MIAETVKFVKTLNLEEKFSPRKNAEIIWFYIFLPSVIAYFILLTSYINEKPFIGEIEVLLPAFKSLIYEGRRMEVISAELFHTDGPLWINDEAASTSYLMFSEVQQNRVYKWEDGKGLFTVGRTILLEKSGTKDDQLSGLVGSSGLLRRSESSLDLIVCQLGERAVSLIAEAGGRWPLATHFKDQRLAAPRDAVLSPEGHLYFSDAGGEGGEEGEGQRGGVYMLRAEHLQLALDNQTASSFVLLADATVHSPVGLAFSPDYSKLYVSSADRTAPRWTVFEVADSGALRKGRVFFDGAALLQQECARLSSEDEAAATGSQSSGSSSTCDLARVGAAEGLKVDIHGNVFASGPGGVLVISPEGQLIGRLRLPADKPVTNLAFSGDGRLYITAGDSVIRLQVRTKPTRIVGKKL